QICEKAIKQGKAFLSGMEAPTFTSEELNTIGKYIHCSANWNAVDYHLKNNISSAVSSSKTFSFVNRPDENWTRTVYDMAGNPQK
ncbi:type VI secretion system tube protein Hcp, partial [Salmonella enterica]|nr:type VI secretion system tube protein Hcp [Salmonella enterica]EGE6714903.1 type VI secretion system tube protein Hcp [Salmonella enterica]